MDVNAVTKGPFLPPFNQQGKEQYEGAIEKIKEIFDRHMLHDEPSSETIITKYENGIIEAYVPIHMIEPNEEITLFRMIHIPLIFKNQVFIKIEESSAIIGVRKLAETPTFFFLQEDDFLKCRGPKNGIKSNVISAGISLKI